MPVDVSGLVDLIGSNGVAVMAVAAAVLSLVVALRAYAWIRRAIDAEPEYDPEGFDPYL